MNDTIDHPQHYNTGDIEVIDAIEAWELGFHLGNAVKYLARAGKKDGAVFEEDLAKAVWYINRKIDELAGSKQTNNDVQPSS
jgi:hypothetical protein